MVIWVAIFAKNGSAPEWPTWLRMVMMKAMLTALWRQVRPRFCCCPPSPYPHPPAAAALRDTMRLDATICEYIRRWGRVVGLLRSCFCLCVVCCLLLLVFRLLCVVRSSLCVVCWFAFSVLCFVCCVLRYVLYRCNRGALARLQDDENARLPRGTRCTFRRNRRKSPVLFMLKASFSGVLTVFHCLLPPS